MALNETYSFKDFMGQSFKDRPASEFNNSTIKGSCFYQETNIDVSAREDIEKHIFPVGIVGVTFERCNLDNVFIPSGNVVLVDCSTRLIQVQNDLEDWVLDDSTLDPIEPTDIKRFNDVNISINPIDIPATRLTEARINSARRTLREE